jgi:hypothetical protein
VDNREFAFPENLKQSKQFRGGNKFMSENTWRNYLENKQVKPAPLKGLLVLEAATIILGPAGPSFLAKLGAEVIKCHCDRHFKK